MTELGEKSMELVGVAETIGPKLASATARLVERQQEMVRRICREEIDAAMKQFSDGLISRRYDA